MFSKVVLLLVVLGVAWAKAGALPEPDADPQPGYGGYGVHSGYGGYSGYRGHGGYIGHGGYGGVGGYGGYGGHRGYGGYGHHHSKRSAAAQLGNGGFPGYAGSGGYPVYGEHTAKAILEDWKAALDYAKDAPGFFPIGAGGFPSLNAPVSTGSPSPQYA